MRFSIIRAVFTLLINNKDLYLCISTDYADYVFKLYSMLKLSSHWLLTLFSGFEGQEVNQDWLPTLLLLRDYNIPTLFTMIKYVIWTNTSSHMIHRTLFMRMTDVLPLSIYLSVCLSVYLSIYLSIYGSVMKSCRVLFICLWSWRWMLRTLAQTPSALWNLNNCQKAPTKHPFMPTLTMFLFVDCWRWKKTKNRTNTGYLNSTLTSTSIKIMLVAAEELFVEWVFISIEMLCYIFQCR